MDDTTRSAAYLSNPVGAWAVVGDQPVKEGQAPGIHKAAGGFIYTIPVPLDPR